MALQFEARKVAMKQDRTGFVLTLSIHPDDLPEELIRDFVGARYGCALVRIQDDESPTPYTNRVAKAGMLCRDSSFQQYLLDTGLILDKSETSAADAVCEACGIDSRSALNGNQKAVALFDELVSGYETWRNEDVF
jgi:hypothetical protein